ncbi:MAG: iron ABC transporter permease, partial [Anaerolineae bacterium]|nr:iron ABC transporter permease [Anaerolineae bacterium]
IITVLTGGQAEKDAWTNIVLKFRLPKALTAVLAGAALSASGLMMQTFFHNPLADPFILGISSGASLGVALVVLSVGTAGGAVLAGIGFVGDFGLALAAGIGAALTMMLVLLVARRVRSATTLLILGLMFGYMTSAIVSFLIYFTIPERVQAYINWGFGTFGGVTWGQLTVLAPAVIVGLVVAFALAKPLNALLLGENYARSMGLNLNRARFAIVLATGVLAGVVTAFCGPIGFIGVAVPHLCRGLFNSSDHRLLIPATVLMGAIVALLAAFVAEVPGSNIVLPVNAVTALFGAPVVIWVILRQRSLQKTFSS